MAEDRQQRRIAAIRRAVDSHSSDVDIRPGPERPDARGDVVDFHLPQLAVQLIHGPAASAGRRPGVELHDEEAVLGQ